MGGWAWRSKKQVVLSLVTLRGNTEDVSSWWRKKEVVLSIWGDLREHADVSS